MTRIRFVLVLAALAGCTSAPAPPPPAAPEPVARAQPVAARVDTVRVCVLERGKMVNARVELQANGDTTVGGRPFSQVYGDTGQYAATHEWYVNNETIDYDPRDICYMKYGLPRHYPREAVVRIGEWRGVPGFRERAEDPEAPPILLIPVGPGCWFQAYQYLPTGRIVACPKPEYRFRVP